MISACASEPGGLDTLGASTDAGPLRQPIDFGVLGPPYATELISFTPGAGAGFGRAELPTVVLGPPRGGGPRAGSLHVVSLGVGGEIVLGFGSRTLVDGPGADLIVFENAFWAGGNPNNVWAEPGEVAVSEDGSNWVHWTCTPTTGGPEYPGCAGWRPTLAYSSQTMHPLTPQQTGGDSFDLAEIGVQSARFVRIRDLSTTGAAPTAGFDLDAVGLINYRDD